MACGALYSRENISIYQGDDWAAAVKIFEADGITPADLTGYTALAQVRTDVADEAPEVVCEFQCVIDVAESQVNISLHHSQTEQFTETKYQFDLELTSPADVVSTVLAGSITVVLEVSRLVPYVDHRRRRKVRV